LLWISSRLFQWIWVLWGDDVRVSWDASPICDAFPQVSIAFNCEMILFRGMCVYICIYLHVFWRCALGWEVELWSSLVLVCSQVLRWDSVSMRGLIFIIDWQFACQKDRIYFVCVYKVFTSPSRPRYVTFLQHPESGVCVSVCVCLCVCLYVNFLCGCQDPHIWSCSPPPSLLSSCTRFPLVFKLCFHS
jgi:hypothetical protein